MKIRWAERSLKSLSDLHAYIFADNPAAADRVVDKIESAIETLRDAPRAGRAGRVPDTRELVIPATPYLVAYTIQSDAIYILAILHGKRSWPQTF